jgi:TPR repeat protein
MRPILVCAVLATAAFALPFGASADTDMDEGFAAVDDFNYARALDSFRAAGDAGNVQGARIAGFMLLYGEPLYGPDVKRDRAAGVALLRKAAAGGCEISAAVLPRIAVAGESLPPVAVAPRERR